jgi:Domain of unknown function (DUF5671)
MPADSDLLKFIEAARTQGASDVVLVGLLKGRGWPEDDIYRALGAHYEKLTGLPIPIHRAATAQAPSPLTPGLQAVNSQHSKTAAQAVPSHRRTGAAKDTFLYLLAFSTLGTWTIGVGSLMFTLIDRWITDPLSSYSVAFADSSSIASSMASLLVAFPIYMLVMRVIISDIERHPEKIDDGVRKWLTYIALFIAASVVIGDLVATLTIFLRGELTSRFVAKAVTVIVISGGVFWYYLGSLKKTPEAAHAIK